MSWKLLNSRTLIEDQWITVRSNDYITGDGRQIDGYYLVERSNFVIVAAESRGKLVMIREYRAGTGRQYLSLPSGHMEPGEDPVAAGLREFREETGFAGSNGRLLAVLDPQPAYLRSFGHVVAIDASDRPVDRATDGEVDAVVLLDWEAAIEKIRTGEIRDMQAVATLYLVRDLLGKG
ncbi:MAG: NUDIX hydrolase [Acidobacteria bacterium]|nr:NUDIX hydrolase [Acidobacteriota bacterium]